MELETGSDIIHPLWTEWQTLVKTLPSLVVGNDGSWLASDRACVQDAPSDRLVKSEQLCFLPTKTRHNLRILKINQVQYLPRSHLNPSYAFHSESNLCENSFESKDVVIWLESFSDLFCLHEIENIYTYQPPRSILLCLKVTWCLKSPYQVKHLSHKI